MNNDKSRCCKVYTAFIDLEDVTCLSRLSLVSDLPIMSSLLLKGAYCVFGDLMLEVVLLPLDPLLFFICMDIELLALTFSVLSFRFCGYIETFNISSDLFANFIC